MKKVAYDARVVAPIEREMAHQMAPGMGEIVECTYAFRSKSGISIKGMVGLHHLDLKRGLRIAPFELLEESLHSLMITPEMSKRDTLEDLPRPFVSSVSSYTDGSKMLLNGEYLRSIVIKLSPTGMHVEWTRGETGWSSRILENRVSILNPNHRLH